MKQTMSNNDFIKLAEKRLQNSVTDEEKARFDEAYHLLQSRYPEWDLNTMKDEEQVKREIYAAMLNNIMRAEDVKTRKLWPRLRIVAGIAAAVATVVFGVWFFNSGREVLNQVQGDGVVNDIAPGRSGATISYSNGEVIQLDSAKTGINITPTSLTYNDGTIISSKVRDPDLRQDDGKALEMTASTTKGQTYAFTLPDGTRVWLNADSRISFPSQFSGKTRKVLISGEGYFEVTKDKNRPFIVESKGQEITVLGTHFNVSAYADDPESQTTLLEGSVALSALKAGKKGQQQIMKPNQMAITDRQYKTELRQTLDAERAIAWRNTEKGAGQMYFEGQSLGSAMRKLARWYNIEVVYANIKPSEELQFSGVVSRNISLAQVVQLLESTGSYHFKIEGRKLIIRN